MFIYDLINQQHNEHLMKTWEHVALVVNEQNLQYKVNDGNFSG